MRPGGKEWVGDNKKYAHRAIFLFIFATCAHHLHIRV